MRLRKAQKEAALKWIAAGMQSDEINEQAATFLPPFAMSRPQITYYRRTRKIAIDALVKAGEQDALSEGLALKGNRVTQLKRLAALLEGDLFGGFLWTEEVKGVGSGDIAEIVNYDVFNRSEVDAYRGVLDDIAKEMGARSKVEMSGPDGGAIPLSFDGLSNNEIRELLEQVRRALGGAVATDSDGERSEP